MSNPIGWCDETWNPVVGCSHVSPACDHCYAERMARRQVAMGNYPPSVIACQHPDRGLPCELPDEMCDGFFPCGWSGKVAIFPDKLDQPLHWKKPRRIFVVSMGDLFHEDVPWWFIAKVFIRMALAPQHTFQLLTKRPERMCEFVLDSLDQGVPVLSNVWLGVTAEDQQRADERIPILLDTPAAVRFVSVEPMLGPVDLYSPSYLPEQGIDYDDDGNLFSPKLDWVICGPETGPGARPFKLQWARGLRDPCVAAGVPFWFKAGLLDSVEWHQRPGTA